MGFYYSPEAIKEVERVGNSLKIKFKKGIFSGSTSEIFVPIKETSADFLMDLVASGLLEAKELTKEDKERIKRKIIKEKADFYLLKNVKAFKKIFKPEDFDKIKFTKLIEVPFENRVSEEKAAILELAEYLNKKEEIKEMAFNDLKKDIKELKKFISGKEDFYTYSALLSAFVILDYYPEFRDRIQQDEEAKRILNSVAKVFIKKSKTLLKDLVKHFRLKEYLVEIL
jgi:hypothetical protein